MTALRQYLEGMDLIISTYDDRDRSKCLEDYVKNASQYNLAVYSGAVSENHPLRKALLNCGVEQLHRFDALNRFLVEQTIVGVSGSHGKTTTSWMLVSILKQFYGNCSWIIGEAQIGENILGYHSPEANHVIVEVDESDGMFYRMRS
ncbi:hypothetical protein N9N03_01800, partial [Chlamydiia bacterium]|nr:hypothetical protein [Chlamydiia bacterium]